jgi:multiple sugar transport system permease protein
MWQQLYGLETGVLNGLLNKFGIDRVEWLSNPNIAMISLAIMATWKNVGLYIILFLVGLQTVPISHYEAAEVEGANDWQQFRYITLPAINPTVFLVFILSTIGGFSLFIEPYIMTDGGPLNSTLSAMLYIYRQAFGYYHMGYATTLGLCFAIMILIVVAIQKKYIESND